MNISCKEIFLNFPLRFYHNSFLLNIFDRWLFRIIPLWFYLCFRCLIEIRLWCVFLFKQLHSLIEWAIFSKLFSCPPSKEITSKPIQFRKWYCLWCGLYQLKLWFVPTRGRYICLQLFQLRVLYFKFISFLHMIRSFVLLKRPLSTWVPHCDD